MKKFKKFIKEHGKWLASVGFIWLVISATVLLSIVLAFKLWPDHIFRVVLVLSGLIGILATVVLLIAFDWSKIIIRKGGK